MNRQERMITAISVIVIFLAAVGYYYLPYIVLSLSPKNGNFIGMVVEAKGEVRMRFGDSINWLKVQKKDRIYSKVYLFTGENSSGIYAFLDKSTISLGPNSLIFLDFIVDDKSKQEDPLSIDLIDGKMEIDLKENAQLKKIKIEDATIDISKQKTTIMLSNEEEKGMEISVMQGNINITKDDRKYNVTSGEKLGVAANQNRPEKGVVSEEVMEEMKEIQAADRQQMVDDVMNNRRTLSFVLKELLLIVVPWK